jgi:hypothetical protein
MSDRDRLPNRRHGENIAFDHGGIRYIAGVSRFADGRLAEVFFHQAGKPGSAVEAHAKDSAVMASHALQRGCALSELQHSVMRLRDESAAGPLGALLDLIADHRNSTEAAA